MSVSFQYLCYFGECFRKTAPRIDRLEGSDHVGYLIGIRQCAYRALFYKTTGGKIFLIFLLCEKNTFRRNVDTVCLPLRTTMHQLYKIGPATATNVEYIPSLIPCYIWHSLPGKQSVSSIHFPENDLSSKAFRFSEIVEQPMDDISFARITN